MSRAAASARTGGDGAPSAGLRARLGGLRRAAKAGEETARTLAGLGLRRLGLERWAAPLPLGVELPVAFRAFRPGRTLVPITCVTPPDGDFLHTFFDVCPLSRSGRYLAVTRLPFGWRGPAPGDLAEICVIDLEARTLRAVHRTDGWALQLGGHLHWHPGSDRFLYGNERGQGRGQGVRIDLEAGGLRRYPAPIYAVAPDGRHALSPALDLINRTQDGYGVPEPLRRRRRLDRQSEQADGLWRTDLESGRSELLLSTAEIVRALPTGDLLGRGRSGLFHSKIDPTGRHVFQVVRSLGLPDRPGALRSSIASFTTEGGDIRLALPHTAWDRGGHHPSWLPATLPGDSRRILMNLVPPGAPDMRFVSLARDGGDMTVLAAGRRGSGHPSVEPGGRFLVTDAYLNEGFGKPDGEAPLRLIDLATGEEWPMAEIGCGPPDLRARRTDPHPAWSRDGRRVILNARLAGRRQVLIAELGDWLDARIGERPAAAAA